MVTRIVFVCFALAIVGGFMWAYHHDVELGKRAAQIEVGDPNEVVRELLGEPSSEGSCGTLTVAPEGLHRRIRLQVLLLDFPAAI